MLLLGLFCETTSGYVKLSIARRVNSGIPTIIIIDLYLNDEQGGDFLDMDIGHLLRTCLIPLRSHLWLHKTF